MGNMKWYKFAIFRHLAVMAISVVVVAIFAFCTLNLSFLNPIATALEEFSVTDIYYQMHSDMGEVRKSSLVTIVDMTELTSRQDIAKTIEEIEKHHPAVLGIDIVFEGLKEDTLGDNMMLDVAEKYSNAIYSYKLLKYIDGQYTEEVHSFFTPFIPVDEGFTNFERKLYGGIKREVTIGQAVQGTIKPSFALAAANKYAGQEVMPLEDRQIEINFFPTDFNEINHRAVEQHPELIDGHIVLLGGTKDEYDMHYTPLGKMAGIELLAYSIETLLQQKEIKTIPLWLLIVITFVVVLLTEVVLSWYKKAVKKLPWEFLSLFMSSNLFITFLMFVLMALYFTIAYLFFCIGNWSINLAWAFSLIVCLNLSQQFYDIFTKKGKS